MKRPSVSRVRFCLRLLMLGSIFLFLGLTLHAAFAQQPLGVPIAAITGHSLNLLIGMLLWIGLAAAGTLGIVGLYEEREIVRRLRGLIETTKRWTDGDLNVRSHLAGQEGEFGQLGLALNEMVGSLARYLLERKQAERREHQRVVELDQAYRDLRETQAQVIQAEKLAMIGRLVSGIIHEVKNPLYIASLSAELLQQQQHQLSPEQIAEAAETIRGAMARADNVIRGLLTLAKPSSLQLAPGNLHDVIAASLLFAEKQLASKHVTVVKELMDAPPQTLLDSTHMQQVLINLAINAQQAMPSGGMVTIRTFTKRLTEFQKGVGRRALDRFQLGEEVLICEVQDTGVGIPADVLEKVFEPFFTTKQPGEGTGLGLAIVHQIIDAHRGVITITSVEGHGTTVRLMLPIVQPKQSAQ